MVVSIASNIAVKYLQWKYGLAAVCAKPPIGWSKYFPAPVWCKVWYMACLRPMWVVDSMLFKRYEKEVARSIWMKS